MKVDGVQVIEACKLFNTEARGNPCKTLEQQEQIERFTMGARRCPLVRPLISIAHVLSCSSKLASAEGLPAALGDAFWNHYVRDMDGWERFCFASRVAEARTAMKEEHRKVAEKARQRS